ncbi:putative necrosis-inducing factor-domain-containing protein [Clohesyomyces aquaticus]|uniref:Putative necrosis-inducing factor-domain-containing protein n=1 Tax=Clohesyomyces aquaticus TaxID=1231657 RepID=A0A1Y1ZQW6_9PLEO|nr:putative necrosis-inducing factor-domain-containing protein [Clohesyomyces aquaticus]
MQFSLPLLAILLSTLTSSTHALPTTSTLERRDDDCNAGSIINQSSSASPSVADCQELVKSIQNVALSQIVTQANGFVTLYTQGTCAFGASTKNVGFVNVGNDNAVDLINASIAMFAAPNPGQKFVGAKGTMGCQITGLTTEIARVDWAIFHT